MFQTTNQLYVTITKGELLTIDTFPIPIGDSYGNGKVFLHYPFDR